MTKKSIILFLLCISVIFKANAYDLTTCKIDLDIVQNKVLRVDHEAIEIVDGYNDMDSIKDIGKCEDLLLEAEATLIRVCKSFYSENLPGLDSLSDLMIQLNKGAQEVCKGLDLDLTTGGGRSEIQEPSNPSLPPQGKEVPIKVQ